MSRTVTYGELDRLSSLAAGKIHAAGCGFEHYLNREKLVIRETPHEHDLMMDGPSLNIIVPEMYRMLK